MRTYLSIFKFLPIASVAVSLAGADITNTPPKGWFAAGSHPGEYLMTVESTVTRNGKKSALIRTLTKKPSGFGTLMQTISAEQYLKKRIRLSGWVKSDQALGGGLWLRVDGEKGELLAFDNMQARGGITGTKDWTQYEIVLDVSDTSVTLNYGILLTKGTLWVENLNLEVVDSSVPLTAGRAQLSKTPINLDFEDR